MLILKKTKEGIGFWSYHFRSGSYYIKGKRYTAIPLDLAQEMLVDFKAKEVIFHYKAQIVILFSSGPYLLLYTRWGCNEDESRFGQGRQLVCLDL